MSSASAVVCLSVPADGCQSQSDGSAQGPGGRRIWRQREPCSCVAHSHGGLWAGKNISCESGHKKALLACEALNFTQVNENGGDLV